MAFSGIRYRKTFNLTMPPTRTLILLRTISTVDKLGHDYMDEGLLYRLNFVSDRECPTMLDQ